MKLIWTTFFVGLVCALLSLNVHADDPSNDVTGAGPVESVAFVRVAMNAQNETYFADGEAKFELKDYAPPAGLIGVAAMQAAESLVFITAESNWYGDWHPAPRKQYVFILGGAIEIKVADGEVRRFSIGDIVLLEDTAGKGHDTRVVSEEPALFAIVAVLNTP
jgi:hypothetical protein